MRHLEIRRNRRHHRRLVGVRMDSATHKSTPFPAAVMAFARDLTQSYDFGYRD